MTEPTTPGRASLTSRLLGVYAVIFVGVIALFTAVATTSVSRVLERQIVDDLVSQGRVIDASLMTGDEATAADVAAAANARLTIIASDGSVAFDSESDADTMEDHGGRPEVLAARTTGTGTDTRPSATLGDERLYVAVRSADQDRIIRLSVTAEQLSADLRNVRLSVTRVAGLVGLLGLALVWAGARRVARPIVDLTAIAEEVAGGEIEPPVRRSRVAEVDRLGVSIGDMASQLGRRIAESEQQRRTLEQVLGALPQGVLLVGGMDDIIYANQTATSLLGSFGDRLSTVAPRGLHRCVREAREGAGSAEAQIDRGSPGRTLQVTATRLDDERVLAVIVDVTERRRVEAIRRDFVADASHELKTPVAAVLASTDALELALSRDPEKARTFARRTVAAAHQLSRIVEDLLDLSRLESSDRQHDSLHLDRIIAEEVEGFRARAVDAGVDLNVDLADVEVVGSASDLALAVRNLCDNAIRYTHAGGMVRVRLERLHMDALISVEDTGAGIPTRALERVFERFFRVDEARSRATGGTGLGLSIVRHVAERHGGTVTVSSQLGVGSTFTMRLPIKRSEEPGARS